MICSLLCLLGTDSDLLSRYHEIKSINSNMQMCLLRVLEVFLSHIFRVCWVCDNITPLELKTIYALVVPFSSVVCLVWH